MRLQRFDRLDVPQAEAPAVDPPQVELATLLVELSRGKVQLVAARGNRQRRASDQQTLLVGFELARFPFVERAVVRVGPSDGLRGVIDQDVEPAVAGKAFQPLQQLREEAEVERVDAQPVPPFGEVGLTRVASRSVAREACGDAHTGAVAQQLERHREADLDAPAGDQRAALGQIAALAAGAPMAVGALGAKRVVVAVDLAVALLAHVAVTLALGLGRLGVGLVVAAVGSHARGALELGLVAGGGLTTSRAAAFLLGALGQEGRGALDGEVRRIVDR